MFLKKIFKSIILIPSIVLVLSFCLALSAEIALAQCGDEDEFTTDFRLEGCKFITEGMNPYFILKPGYRLALVDEEGALLKVTVLHHTKRIDLRDEGLGKVKTRVVEEREWDAEGNLIEVSKNYFAICKQTNAVYYFGEDVDICEDGLEKENGGYLCSGEEPSHEGSWLAGQPAEEGQDPAKPGLIMPGTFLQGSKYFQEIAPEVALDRAENVEMGLVIESEAGEFEECVYVEETSSLECDEVSEKIYCPGVGLVADDEFELVSYGKKHRHDDDDDDDGKRHHNDDDDDDD